MINYSVLKDISRLRKYLSGSTIYESAEMEELYIVLKGEVGLFSAGRDDGRELVGTIGPGGFFGDASLASGKRPPQSALALTDVIAVPLSDANAAAFMQEEPELAFELIKALCQSVYGLKAAQGKAAGPAAAAKQAAPQAAAISPAKATPQPKTAPQPKPAPQPATAAAAKPKPAARAAEPAEASPLFPEGHGSYTLELHTEDRTYLMESTITCPMCKKEFTALRVKSSRLVVERVDEDMRNRYRGVEPIYYDVITCPHCLYSALTDMFKTPNLLKADLSELMALRPVAGIQTGAKLDTDSIFAGYYLALRCAQKCFTAHTTVKAKLLLKLSRIYQDCGDHAMEKKTSRQALEAYTHIYINEESTPEIDQQLCLIIGELHLKLGDIKNARDYFFKVKTNREGSPVLKTQAENRLGEIRGA